jgi:hypothetical protein
VFFVVAMLSSTGVLTSELSAQQPQPTRVRGTIETVEGNVLSVRSKEGQDVRIQVGKQTEVIGSSKIELGDIQANTFVGVTAAPLENGLQKAISVHVSPEFARGFNEGSRGYDVRPNSSMTNGALSNPIKSVDHHLQGRSSFRESAPAGTAIIIETARTRPAKRGIDRKDIGFSTHRLVMAIEPSTASVADRNRR